jgi:hypothetical protein
MPKARRAGFGEKFAENRKPNTGGNVFSGGKIGFLAAMVLACGPAAHADLIISFSNGPGVAFSGEAQNAAQVAAESWNALLANSITVNIQLSFASLPSGVLGSSNITTQAYGYSTVQTALAAESSEPGKSALANLPSASTLMNSTLPSGYTVSNAAGDPTMSVATADAKALGLSTGATYDGSIQVAESFFPGYLTGSLAGASYDLESILTHEIGHVLGFLSAEDVVDESLHSGLSSGLIALSPLDLFRFATTPLAGDFISFDRDLTPSSATQVLSDGVTTYAVSTGTYFGNGYQASHWVQGGGLMQPALAPGSQQGITSADLWAFEMIGYDVATPEPGTILLIGIGLCGLVAVKMRTARG